MVSKVKRMEKAEVELWLPNAHGVPELQKVEKYLWMCTGCGLVWATHDAARNCEKRGHKPYFVRYYGGRFVNGQHVGGYEAKFYAIRKEEINE